MVKGERDGKAGTMFPEFDRAGPSLIFYKYNERSGNGQWKTPFSVALCRAACVPGFSLCCLPL